MTGVGLLRLATEPFLWTERNLRWKTEAVAIALLALSVGVLFAQSLGVRSTSPAAYAAAYIEARAAGDPEAIWAAMTVDASRTTADASLLTKQALAGMLKVVGNRTPVGDVTASVQNAGARTATVAVSYREEQATRRATLSLVRDPAERRHFLYPVWKVVVTPTVLRLSVPAGAGPVSVDGLTVPGSARSLAVLPGVHQLTIGASSLFQVATETVGAGAASGPIAFRLKLTDQAAAQAAELARAALTKCAAATTLAPPNCPNAVVDSIDGAATWQLYGDPSAGAGFSVDDAGLVVARGHYQMAVTYQGDTPRVRRHRAIAGPYEAAFAWDGSSLLLKNIGLPTGSVTEMPRPTVDDATVVGVVRAGFDRCAAATTAKPVDCPQFVTAFGALANFAWRLAGDPVAGSTVTFDGTTGMFRVAGTFSMTATYDETYEYQATYHRTTPSTGRYTADLFWDGQKPVFVAFE